MKQRAPLSLARTLALLAAASGLGCASAVAVDESKPVPATASAEPAGAVPVADTTGAGAPAAAPAAPAAATTSRPERWSTLMKAGRTHLAAGELAEAEDRFTRAYDRTLDLRPGDPRTRTTARNLERTAIAYREAGDAAGYARVTELLVYIAETNPEARSAELASLLQGLAATRMLEGNMDAARAAVERTIALVEEENGPGDPQLVGPLSQLALLLVESGEDGELDAAEQTIDRAATIGADSAGPDSPLYATTLVPRAKLEMARGQTDAAREALLTAIDISVEYAGEASPGTAQLVRELAMLEQEAGDTAAAERAFERVISIWDTLPRENYQRAQSRNELAWFLVEIGDPQRAESPARSALGILEEQDLGGQPFAAIADTLATALRDQRKYEEAETLYRQALQEGAKERGLPGWDLSEIAGRYAVLLEETGRAAEAAELRDRWASSTKVSDS